MSIFKRNKNNPGNTSSIEKAKAPLLNRKQSTITLLPGSEGEHLLQEKYGSRQRALKFYDKQVINHLSPLMQDFISLQEVMFIATADSHGECDCSARFGKPGFVRVINQNFIVYPEYRGNGVLASQGNIHENPHIGVIFTDFFTTTVGLHVNGAARIIENTQLKESWQGLPEDILNEIQRQGNKQPERWIMIEVKEAYIHCSKHIPLLKKMDKRIDWGTDDVSAKGGDFFQLKQLELYDRIGGIDAIKKAVDVLYRKILTDDELNQLFDNMEITTQVEYLTTLMSIIFGKPELQLQQDKLGLLHTHLADISINQQQYGRLIRHINASLLELEVPEHEIDTILQLLKPSINTIMPINKTADYS